jgi:hypothetical protein
MTGDVDAVRAGDQTLFAWTDDSHPDAEPVLASIDGAGHVRGPNRAFDGGAGGTLVGLAAGPAGGVIAWEEPFRRGRASKRVVLARVDLTAIAADASAEIALDLQGRGAPELAGLADGFGLLAPTRVCAVNAPCDDAAVLPTFVRFDAKLAPVQVEPLRLGILRDPASAGWGMSCDSGNACLALAAVPAVADQPLRVLAVDLARRAVPFRAPTPLPPPPSPSPTSPPLASGKARSSRSSLPRTTRRPSATIRRASQSRLSTEPPRPSRSRSSRGRSPSAGSRSPRPAGPRMARRWRGSHATPGIPRCT